MDNETITLMDNEITTLLDSALSKVNSDNVSDLCKYLPSGEGYQMHHFALKKMMKKNPSKFKQLVKEFILSPHELRSLDSKPRAPRQSNKGHSLNFSSEMLMKLTKMAMESGDEELIAQLRPGLTLKSLKNEFIETVRKGEIDEHLWSAYKEAVIRERR